MPCFILRIKNNQEDSGKKKKQVIHVFNNQMNVIFVRDLQYMNLKNTIVHCCKKKIILLGIKNFFEC